MGANIKKQQVIGVQNVYQTVPQWLKNQLSRIERKLDQLLTGATEFRQEEVAMANTLQEVLGKVQEQTTVDQGMFQLIDGLKGQITDALSKIGQFTPEQQAAIDQVFGTAQQNVADVAAKLLENTPQAPPAAAPAT